MFNYNLLSSPPSPNGFGRVNKLVVLCLLMLIVFAVFGQAIWFDYVQLDEGTLLVNNHFFISKITNFAEVFKHDINYPSAVAPYYRPMFILSFMLNSQFDKLMAGQISSSPLAYHVGNLLLHIIAAFFVFGLLRELGTKRFASFLFSVLFAIHPAVTPVVAWVPGRIEAILAIFTLLSFIMFIRFLRTSDWRFLLGFLLSFTVAIFTKEVAVALLPILIFYYLMHRKEKGGEMLVTLASGLVGVIVAWFFIRRNIMAGVQVNDLSFYQILAVLWSNSLAIFLYLGKTLLPFNLTVLTILENSQLAYGFIILAVLVSYWFFRKIQIISLSAFGIIWFLVFLLPVLTFLGGVGENVLSERYFFGPSIGFSFLLASLFSRALATPRIGKLGALLALSFLLIISWLSVSPRNLEWRDNITLYTKTLRQNPDSHIVRRELAAIYIEQGDLEKGKREFEEILKKLGLFNEKLTCSIVYWAFQEDGYPFLPYLKAHLKLADIKVSYDKRQKWQSLSYLLSEPSHNGYKI